MLLSASRRHQALGALLRPARVKDRYGNGDPGLGPAERVIADAAERKTYGIREHRGVEIEKRRARRQLRRCLHNACDRPAPETIPDRKSGESKLGAKPPEYVEARRKLTKLFEPVEDLVTVPRPGWQERFGVKAELPEPDAKERIVQEHCKLRAEQRQP